ncbi:MAG: hypothetical protein ACJA09_000500 [Alcanivorax sp.]|jgi:hypothetical protein
MGSHQFSAYVFPLLVALAFVTYAFGLPGGLQFDDIPTLVENAKLNIASTEFDSWRISALSAPSGPLGRPIGVLTFGLNRLVPEPFYVLSLKLVNVLIHLFIAWLVWVFARQVASGGQSQTDSSPHSLWFATLVSALWLFNPLHVSTVLYAVQRLAQLSTLFVLAGLCLFMVQRRRWVSELVKPGEVLSLSLWLTLFLMLALYSKENGVLLPWLVLAAEVCFFRGVWAGKIRPALRRSAVVALIMPAVVILTLAMFPLDFIQNGYIQRDFDLAQRVLTQLRLSWTYIGWFLMPEPSALGFHHDDIIWSQGWLRPATTLLSLLAWVVVLTVAVKWRDKSPVVLFGLLFYLIGHSLESSIFGLEMVFEHRNYLPSVGIALVTAALFFALRKYLGSELNFCLLSGGAVAVFALLLLARTSAWSDNLGLSASNVYHHPESARSHYAYAYNMLELYRSEDLDEESRLAALFIARQHFSQMLEIDNDSLAALVSLHRIDNNYLRQEEESARWMAKIAAVAAVKQLNASDGTAIGVLIDCVISGGCVAKSGDLVKLLRTLRDRYPTHPLFIKLEYSYGSFLGVDGSKLRALREEAIRLQPYNPEFYHEAITACSETGDVGCMYSNMQSWLKYDTRRSDLIRLKRMFIEPAN